ncbi:DisA bacterial checkpoint controller nucleotide-binding protein [uncultured archaeon]|nr:DisA bacterial checkpoint controller nucleotide-binding protein [uncultured archaeon]
MILWRNVLSDEGRKIAKRAEKAEDAGDYVQARELYLEASAKFRGAADISEDFRELGILRTFENNMKINAQRLEKDCMPQALQLKKKETEDTSSDDVALHLKGTGVREQVIEAVLKIAIEISGEGREGHAIGTAFIVGDEANVMLKSRQLVLNPFEGHSKDKRLVTEPENWGNIKEFAQLDGVFVIAGDGTVEAAGRYITVDTGMVKIPRGFGTRHSSVAAITSVTHALGVVVSQSGGVIRIFKDGKIVASIKP